jgi:cytochrome P450
MTLVTELQLPSLDYTEPTLRGPRFHAAMRELREQHWLASGPYGYVVLDREACELFLRTRSAVFPGMKIAEIFGVSEGPLYEEMRRNILHINGADHTRLRSLVNPALAPRAVERYRPLARRLLEELFARSAQGAGEGESEGEGGGAGDAREDAEDGVRRCEFVEAFAKPYPSQVIAAVMGAPLEDAPRLHHWSTWIQRQFDAAAMMEQREGIEQAVVEFYEWCGELVARRRADAGDDLISKLIAAEEQGERLSDVECVNLVLNVLIGGVDTTQSQLSHAMRLFAEHPEQWALLAERPELAAQAVEEVLRVEPITPFTARIVTEELEFRGITFPAQTIVMVCAFTGNRDPSGEDFDIAVDRGKERALTFGAGIHYCLGANLARVELQEAMTYLPSRMPELTLDGEPVYESIMGIYGLSELPVRFAVR